MKGEKMKSKKNGIGKIVLANGDRYEGECKEGKKDGKGKKFAA